MYKPLKFRDYIKWISQYGWALHKGKIDWNLFDQYGIFVCSIKILHPGPKEVSAGGVQKTERKLKEKGLL